MVMHARKPQRLNDGYFDKHQSHQYQNSKYSSKRDYEREASSRSTNYGRDRDLSPVGGSVINGNSYDDVSMRRNIRSVSPELDSPRDRDRDRGDRYQSGYMQKMREKDRDRDYKKEKYSDCLRSPKDKRSRTDRDEHRTNHDRRSKLSSTSEKRGGSSSNSDDRERERDRNDRERDRVERDRVNRIGDWSEHVSSSGKKYYYNCKTEVSQWEKPREWLEKESRALVSKDHRDYRDKERDRDRDRSDRERERERERDRDRYMSANRSASYSSKHSNNSKNSSRTGRTRRPDDISRRRHEDNPEMDISPDSTPTSEASYSHSSTPIQQAHNTNNNSNNEGPVLLANARLVSNPQQQILSSAIMQHQHLIANVASSDITLTSNAPGPPIQAREKALNSPLYNISHGSASISNQNNSIGQTNQLLSGDGLVDFHGPPTPTQEIDSINDRKLEGTTVSSLHSVMTSSQAGRPQGPNLTPSLANYFRADLIAHVTAWPSEILEKNVQKLSEETHILGDLQCSKVSTELKCARSLVRITEITATLQEQKIMYLRQQIRRLEELQSQNSFMSSGDL